MGSRLQQFRQEASSLARAATTEAAAAERSADEVDAHARLELVPQVSLVRVHSPELVSKR